MAKIILTAVIEVNEEVQESLKFYTESPESLLQDCQTLEVTLKP